MTLNSSVPVFIDSSGLCRGVSIVFVTFLGKLPYKNATLLICVYFSGKSIGVKCLEERGQPILVMG